MPPSSFLTLLENSQRPIVCDGAMGTLLHNKGVDFDQCFDELNLTNPGLIAEIHREYINAGAQFLKTNTFGANRFKLVKHGLEHRVEEINRAGADLAHRVIFASFKPVFIAGDVGPLGVRLAPFGRVKPEQAREAFTEQIRGLIEGGADLILVETMSDVYEAREAILASRDLNPQIPVIASMTFTRDDRTLLGDSPAKVAQGLYDAGADIIGVNCSGGPNQILRILKLMRQAVPDARYSVMPNAGWPQLLSGRIMYPAAAEYFGEYALNFWQAGACIIGGCCGTTPQHIAAMRSAIDTTSPESLHNGNHIQVSEKEEASSPAERHTQFAEKLRAGRFTIAVEMDPPRGLATHKLMAGASLLSEAGADVINVADSPMARMRMSPWAVCSLIQRRVEIETVLHFPTRGRNLLRVQGDLLAAHALGVRNVFVVMGDPTAIGDYPDAMDNFDLVPSGLIKLIKQNFNAGLDHAGADIGQPTSFFVGCALNLCSPNPDQEIKNLRRKLRAGADFILTQPIYDPAIPLTFLKTYEDRHGKLPIPLLIGLLPLHNDRHAAFLQQEVPGVLIPEGTIQRLKSAGEDAPREGVKLAIELIQAMRPHAEGVYIMPAFSRYDLAAEIIDAVVEKRTVVRG